MVWQTFGEQFHTDPFFVRTVRLIQRSGWHPKLVAREAVAQLVNVTSSPQRFVLTLALQPGYAHSRRFC